MEDDDIINLAWEMLDQYRLEEEALGDEKDKEKQQQKASGYNDFYDAYQQTKPECHGCLVRAPFFNDRNGDRVCVNCGMVLETNNIVSVEPKVLLSQYQKVIQASYKHVFHWNERIAQLNCTDPEIPVAQWTKILHVWKLYNDRFVHRLFTKSTVIDLLTLTDKYYKHDRKTSLRRIYTERWISIRFYLTGQRPPSLTMEYISEIEKMFLLVVFNWNELRHAKDCKTPSNKCHKLELGCRKNLPNYNFMHRQFIYHLNATHHDSAKFEWTYELLPYLPTLKTKSRLEELNRRWIEMEETTKIPLYEDVEWEEGFNLT